MSDRELRRRLQEITDQYTGWEVHLQLPAIEGLRAETSHSVTLVQEAVLGEPRTWDFNCHAFSFGLHRLEAFWELRDAKPNVWPTGEFVCDRLLPVMTEIIEGAAGSGALLLYFEGQRLKHSGVVVERSVESKWGTAHRWCHPVFEVPASFGDGLRYFKRPDPAAVAAAYLKFAAAA